MKKITSYSLAIFFIATFFALTSCNQGDLVLKYNMTEQTISLPANPYQTYTTFSFPISHTDVQAIINAGGGNISKLKSAVAKGLNAQVTTTGSDFSQISSIEVYLRPTTNTTTDGTQIAYSNGLGAGVSSLLLQANGADVKDLITTDMTLFVKVLPVASGNNAIGIKLNSGYLELHIGK